MQLPPGQEEGANPPWRSCWRWRPAGAGGGASASSAPRPVQAAGRPAAAGARGPRCAKRRRRARSSLPAQWVGAKCTGASSAKPVGTAGARTGSVSSKKNEIGTSRICSARAGGWRPRDSYRARISEPAERSIPAHRRAVLALSPSILASQANSRADVNVNRVRSVSSSTAAWAARRSLVRHGNDCSDSRLPLTLQAYVIGANVTNDAV